MITRLRTTRLRKKHLASWLFAMIAIGTSVSQAQIRITTIGASVAAGYGVAPSESYPSQMGVILGSNWAVENEGESGSTLLEHGTYPYKNLDGYKRALVSNPDIVTIELGSNDSKPGNWPVYNEFVSDYSRLIDTFRALPSHPVIYICIPIPAYKYNFEISDSVLTYGIIPMVRQVAALKNVTLIDLNTPLRNHEDWYQEDGIHPNATGARKIAEVISRVLAAPINLTASVASKSQINLTWADRTNETGFTIQRSADNATWNNLTSVPANTTRYQDTGLTATTRYYYRISATISVGSSSYSNIATDSTRAGTLVPAITSAATATGTAGVAFRYNITATNTPLSYSATGLPQGITVNTQTGVISGTSISSGIFNITIKATNADGTAVKKVILTLSKATTQQPYHGTPFTIPGKIEAEEFDFGGEGIAYAEWDAANQGGYFRTAEGVDIEVSSDGGYDVGYINTGEWMKYSVNVTRAGSYTLQSRVAAPGEGGLMHVELDGVNISGLITIPNTNGWQTWTTMNIVTSSLQTGAHVIRIVIDNGGFNIDYLNFKANAPEIKNTAFQAVAALPYTGAVDASFNPTAYSASGLPAGLSINTTTGQITGVPTQAGVFNVTFTATNISGTGSGVVPFTVLGGTPFSGSPITIPGTLEIEDFDLGGQNVAYFDNDNNRVGAYRPSELVDVEWCNEGGYDLGAIYAGEWLSYTVDIQQAGVYTLEARVSAPYSQKGFHVELNGKDISGPIIVPNSGDWQAWRTISVTTSALNTGRQILRVVMDTDGFNMNYLRFTNAASREPVVLFPNPASSAMTIHLEGTQAKTSEHYTVRNVASGQTSSVVSVDGVVDVSNLPNGLYTIDFMVNKKRIQKTFVKQ